MAYLSDFDRAHDQRFLSRKYGLSAREAAALARHPRRNDIEAELEAWRARHGWPASDSPLSRGKLLEMLAHRKEAVRQANGAALRDDTSGDTGALHGYASGDVVQYEIRGFAGMVQIIDMSRSRGNRALQRIFSPTLMPQAGESKAMLVAKELRKLGTTTATARSGTMYEGRGKVADPIPVEVTKKTTLVGFSKGELKEIYELVSGGTGAARVTRLRPEVARALVMSASRKARGPASEWLRRDEEGTWERRAVELHEQALRSPRYDPRKVDQAISGRLALEAMEAFQRHSAHQARARRAW